MSVSPYFLAGRFFASGYLLGAMLLRFARRAAFTDGRTITWPPSEPGTAPRISSRLRSASISTTFRFSMVRRMTPMWPDMRLPWNTRPGVWRWPIEPGVRCDNECAVRRLAAGEVVALHRAGEALADGGAGDIDDLARLEDVGLELGAGGEIGAFACGEAEFDQRLARLDLGFGVVARGGLREQLRRLLAERHLDGAIAVVLDGLHLGDAVGQHFDRR